ncbi:MAG: hypothetical protein WBS19_22810 [Candidatus Korobacteraceae bacterium]
MIGLATLSLSLFAIVGSMAAQTRQAPPVPTAPKEMTFKSLRAVQYCEVWLFTGTPETGMSAIYYNTAELNDKANKLDTCPDGMWAKVSPEKLAATYDITFAYKNGPRGFTLDTLELPSGPVEDFEGVKARWMGHAVLPKGVKFEGGPPAYHPAQSHRKSTMTFLKGKPVFIIQDPDGTPYVMQAFSKIKDPSLTYDSLKDLGGKLQLAPGWKYRVVALDKDLTISTPQGFAYVAFDDLGDAYDGCKEGACNFQP